MQLTEIENYLPHGFRNAVVHAITIDFASRRALIGMRVWVGDSDVVESSERYCVEFWPALRPISVQFQRAIK
jgi:hypothetical protein